VKEKIPLKKGLSGMFTTLQAMKNTDSKINIRGKKIVECEGCIKKMLFFRLKT
jgi:hypothetical protein